MAPASTIRLQRDDVRLEAVLEEDAQLDTGAVGGGDQGVGLGRRDVERLLDEDVQTAFGRRDALLGVERGWAADGDEIHRTVIEERFEAAVGDAAVALGEALRFLDIAAVHRRNLDAGDRQRRARVGVADASGTDDADSNGHRRVGSGLWALGSSKTLRPRNLGFS